MHLVLKRQPSTSKSTSGALSIDGKFECFTLEDVVRAKKSAGQTAIPAGTYKVIINQSNRFKRLLPLLLNVPGFEGVRIHTGNYAGNEIKHSTQPLGLGPEVLRTAEYLEVYD